MADRAQDIIKGELAFEHDHKGYHFAVWYLTEPKGEALAEITKNGEMVKSFLWPAYKVFNISAHADDIVEGLEAGNDSGLHAAGSTGLGGNVYSSPGRVDEIRVVLEGVTYKRDDCGTWWILYGDESGPHSWSHTSGVLAVALERCASMEGAIDETLVNLSIGLEDPYKPILAWREENPSSNAVIADTGDGDGI